MNIAELFLHTWNAGVVHSCFKQVSLRTKRKLEAMCLYSPQCKRDRHHKVMNRGAAVRRQAGERQGFLSTRFCDDLNWLLLLNVVVKNAYSLPEGRLVFSVQASPRAIHSEWSQDTPPHLLVGPGRRTSAPINARPREQTAERRRLGATPTVTQETSNAH